MNKMKINYFPIQNEWALITGATSGLGFEYCQQLARRGVNLVMVGRDSQKMQKAISQISGVQILPVLQDLSQADAAAHIHRQVLQKGIQIRLLVNNAAIGKWGEFRDGNSENDQEQFNILLSWISLVRLFLPELQKLKGGSIIQVSSVAAYQPIPYMSIYAGLKAFVQSWSLALYEELRQDHVYVQTLVPGGMETSFDSKAGAYPTEKPIKKDSVETVVQRSIAAFEDLSPVVNIPSNTFFQKLFANFFPVRFVLRQVGQMFRPKKGF